MENLIINSRKAKPLLLLLVAIALSVLPSCRHEEVYYQFGQVEDAKWYRDSVFTFVVDSALFDLDTRYNIDIEITNNTSYAYQNIWYAVSHNLDNDTLFTTKQNQYYLSDEDGVWLGSGFGSLYHISIPFRQGVVFSEKRDYSFRISQAMRDEPLIGIEKVGLKISKVS
ncbi:gliding motility lipoprotein GldH [Dysgonomonas sp. 25]|uniref:gliding motility lipoprotein GldH n=1 Tax=Dysgonomonas sp. 25 TaxID=2302933 RepID=UPI0013D72878|nr:gliding motility lipoprotein GldH [Dysgonomonas sp. 25]NDV68771.1 gliding motility lipoprotein GldH [Dysgonomonas sp. 25]